MDFKRPMARPMMPQQTARQPMPARQPVAPPQPAAKGFPNRGQRPVAQPSDTFQADIGRPGAFKKGGKVAAKKSAAKGRKR